MTDLQSFFNKSAFYKEKSLEMADLLEKSKIYDFSKNADNIRHCADRITIGNLDNGNEKIISSYCRLRYCPQCQYRKSIKNFGQIIKVANSLNCAWIHLVLTIRNCESADLSKSIDVLFKNSTKFFNNYKKNFKGVLRACEVTYNKTEDTYHPHLHCLIAVNKSYFTSRYYVKQKDLLLTWRALLNDKDNGGVFVSRVTDKSCSVAEIAKYCLKPLDCDIPEKKRLEVYQNIFTALKGKRLLQTFGVISKELKKVKEDYSESIQEEETLCETFYYYSEKGYRPTAINNKVTDVVYNLKKVN